MEKEQSSFSVKKVSDIIMFFIMFLLSYET